MIIIKKTRGEFNVCLLLFLDYLLSHPTTIKTRKGPLIHLETLWPVVYEIGELWTVSQEKTRGGTLGLGDVWPCPSLGDNQFVPFHKLSQWLVYSLIEPMEKLMGAIIEGTEQLTPLPDYSNGKSFSFIIYTSPYVYTNIMI